MTELIKPITAQEAAKELLAREEGRNSLIGFSKYVQANYEADPFHYLLAEKLEAVERGDIDRLMIFTPPRHGKTELSSIKFGAWFMARNPGHNIIQASYNLDQATRSSRFTRNIIQNNEAYKRLFPNCGISSDSRSADRWMLESGQEYFAVGVGTGATGKGAHLAILDDLVKDREEADSDTRRQTIWDWYNDVLYTRLERNGRIILIMTRWHYDDIAGRLLKAAEKDGDKWEVVNFPALCIDPSTDALGREKGEALAPGRKTAEELERIKRNLGERTWSALFQQEPISEEGAMFKPAWFQPADRIPVGIKRVRAWDFGSTSDGDYTVGVLMGKDRDGIFYIEDVVRERFSPHKVEQLVRDTAYSDRQRFGRGVQIRIPQDPGQAGVSQAASYIKMLAGFPIKAIRPTGPKETRAAGFAAQAEAGNVKLKGGAAWAKPFIEELGLFPLGSHDDQVDAASDAFNALLTPMQAKILDW